MVILAKIVPLDSPTYMMYNISMPQLDLEQLYQNVKKQHAPVIEGEFTVDNSSSTSGASPSSYDHDLPVVHAPIQVPNGPLHTLDTGRMSTKPEVMAQLNSALPLNGFNLPIFYYRADLIDHGRLKGLTDLDRIGQDGVDDLDAMMHTAMQHLTYEEGYPVTPEGQPFWRQLSFEPPEHYTAFLQYMELEGARKLADLAAYPLSNLVSWFHMYMWDWRIKSYDMYAVAHHQRLRVQRAMTAEDKHFKQSAKVMDMIESVLASPEFEAAVRTQPPAVIVAMMEKMVKIQRVSVGLHADGKESEGKAIKPPTISVVMEQISQNLDGNSGQKGDEFRDIMNDPESLEAAQKLILRIEHSNG